MAHIRACGHIDPSRSDRTGRTDRRTSDRNRSTSDRRRSTSDRNPRNIALCIGRHSDPCFGRRTGRRNDPRIGSGTRWGTGSRGNCCNNRIVCIFFLRSCCPVRGLPERPLA